MKTKKKGSRSYYNLRVSLKNTVPYQYFFKKIKDKVYRFSKIGDEGWRQDLMPFKHEPFIYWSDEKTQKNNIKT